MENDEFDVITFLGYWKSVILFQCSDLITFVDISMDIADNKLFSEQYQALRKD